jgi:hypothetical protein
VIADQFPSWLHPDVPEWLICGPAPMLSKTMTERTDSATWSRFEDTEEEFIRALHRLGIPDAGRADAGSAQG